MNSLINHCLCFKTNPYLKKQLKISIKLKFVKQKLKLKLVKRAKAKICKTEENGVGAKSSQTVANS